MASAPARRAKGNITATSVRGVQAHAPRPTRLGAALVALAVALPVGGVLAVLDLWLF